MAGKRSLPDYCCAACGVTFRPLRKGSRFKLNLSNAERAARSERMRSMRAIAKATGAS